MVDLTTQFARDLDTADRTARSTIAIGEVVAASDDGRRVDVELDATGLQETRITARGIVMAEPIVGLDDTRATALATAIVTAWPGGGQVAAQNRINAIATALTDTWAEAIEEQDLVDYVRRPVVRATGVKGDIVIVAFPGGIEAAGGYVIRRLARNS